MRSIILDCHAFFGNSGGLVLEVAKQNNGDVYYRAIGLVSQLIPFLGQWVENSGYSVAVAIDVVEDLIAQLDGVSDK